MTGGKQSVRPFPTFAAPAVYKRARSRVYAHASLPSVEVKTSGDAEGRRESSRAPVIAVWSGPQRVPRVRFYSVRVSVYGCPCATLRITGCAGGHSGQVTAAGRAQSGGARVSLPAYLTVQRDDPCGARLPLFLEKTVKPILIGSDNPHSSDPTMALTPYIPGTTGHRIWKMLNGRVPSATHQDYVTAFQRVNLEDFPLMESSSGSVIIPNELQKIMKRSTVVLFGDNVRRAFGLPKLFLHPIERDGVVYRQVPHPSGVNRFYNDPTMRELVAMLLEELYASSGRSHR